MPGKIKLVYSALDIVFSCPRLPKAGVGYIAFGHDVTSFRACVRLSHSYRSHNLDTFYARQLKLVCYLPSPKPSNLLE